MTTETRVDNNDLTNCSVCGTILGKSETYCWKCEQDTPAEDEGLTQADLDELEAGSISSLALSNITLDRRLMIRSHLDGDTVGRYREIIADLPPVAIFNDSETYWLADGFHRWEAAQLEGLSEIAVVVREGTFNNALEHAAIANTQHGKNLTREEYKTATFALKQVHPDWTSREIGKALNRHHSTIQDYLNANEVRTAVGIPTELNDTRLLEIKPAPSEKWEPIVEAAERENWSSDTIRDVVKEVKAPETPPERIEALLSGKAAPIAKEEGEVGIRPETIAREIKKARDNSVAIPLYKAMEAISQLMLLTPLEIVDKLSEQDVNHVAKNLPRYIDFQNELVRLSKQKTEIVDWEAEIGN